MKWTLGDTIASSLRLALHQPVTLLCFNQGLHFGPSSRLGAQAAVLWTQSVTSRLEHSLLEGHDLKYSQSGPATQALFLVVFRLLQNLWSPQVWVGVEVEARRVPKRICQISLLAAFGLFPWRGWLQRNRQDVSHGPPKGGWRQILSSQVLMQIAKRQRLDSKEGKFWPSGSQQINRKRVSLPARTTMTVNLPQKTQGLRCLF